MNQIYTYGSAGVNGNRLILNDHLHIDSEGKNNSEILNDFYKALNPSYPKFYKMDMISKLVFVVTELLLSDLKWVKEIPVEKVSILFTTDNGSQETDNTYKESIASSENYFPSPGVFVYTLPNIAVGELCIRHGFKGENLTLVGNSLKGQNSDLVMKSWFENNDTEICIHGSADVYGNTLSATFSISGTISPNK